MEGFYFSASDRSNFETIDTIDMGNDAATHRMRVGAIEQKDNVAMIAVWTYVLG